LTGNHKAPKKLRKKKSVDVCTYHDDHAGRNKKHDGDDGGTDEGTFALPLLLEKAEAEGLLLLVFVPDNG
jgi:hypothetical protein